MNAPFTPKPPQDFPHVHGHDSTHHVDNVCPDFADGWTANDGGMLVVHILGENGHDPVRGAPLARAVGQAINRHFNTTGTRVVQSVPDIAVSKAWEPPHAFFVSSLTQTMADSLLSQRVWLTTTIRFIAYPIHAILQSYLGGVQGLCNFEDQSDLPFIGGALLTLFKKRTNPLGRAINNYLHGYNDGENAPNWDEERVNGILTVLYLTRIETLGTKKTPQPTVNMYLPINSYNDDAWARIKDAASRVEYAMPMHGFGTFQAGWTCDECHSVDHPTGLCPFNSIPGDIGMSDPAVPRDDKRPIFQPKGKGSGDLANKQSRVLSTPTRN